MSIHMSENEFRHFLRRFLVVEREHRGVTIRINQIDAERYLGKDKQATEHIMNDASEFICLIADKIVAEIKQDLKTGESFPYPIDDYR